MTVIAWDGATLAADRQTMLSGLKVRTQQKIFRLDDGRLFGGSGETALVRAMLNWFQEGEDPAKYPQHKTSDSDWDPCVIIAKDCLKLYERTPYPNILPPQIFALGSGRDYALAVMHLGHSAEKAVEVASHFDIGCGFGCTTLKLD